MQPEYRIYISSHPNGKSAKTSIIRSILEMGHIPIDTEAFPVADNEQWAIVKRQIDQSDYYVIVIAHQHGSPDDGVCCKEKEYDYATRAGIPVLGFIIDDGVNWSLSMAAADNNKQYSVERLKSKIINTHVVFWNNNDDIYAKFPAALMRLINTRPRSGWVRTDSLVDPDANGTCGSLKWNNAKLTELNNELKNENKILRSQLAHKLEGDHQTIPNSYQELSYEYQRLVKSLMNNKTPVCYRTDAPESEWQGHVEKTLLDIYLTLAPKLIAEASTTKMMQEVVFAYFGYEAHDAHPVPQNYIDLWINDLACLDLITPSTRNHSVHDSNQYWMLTEEGFRLHATLRKLELLDTN